ncbi:uncharacterized protein BX663DRAFT_447586 [Cokeromyces recurvatus]|uniref:uncharacterized protein n=1 Tax=Cokeromyces recurvatus TaxID=90255 RepID=UPI00221FC0C5|nr:uncharacterized protein BX663DRAFT_447586 [Cokeromyces recurvatus]KAI7907380.1 hypothetical protein BX663DRAFT_447586 [Cokeromyces recurvatus]
MFQIGAKLRGNIRNEAKRRIHLQRHYPLIRPNVRPRIMIPNNNNTLFIQHRSISIIPTIVRTTLKATRLPLILTGTALAGASAASDKFQELANKGHEFISDIKGKLNSFGESIEDIDIRIPEMNIKLSDLLRDILKRDKSVEESSSLNHTYNTKETSQEKEGNIILQPLAETEKKETVIIPQSIVKEEEKEEEEEEVVAAAVVVVEEEEEEEEEQEENAALKMKYQDQQFLLLCKKFANIRNTLLSIHHPIIPAIPSMVIIGSRGIDDQDNSSTIVDSILGQPFLLAREVYNDNTVFEFRFVNDPDLKEPRVELLSSQQTEGKKYFDLKEASELIKQQINKKKHDDIIRISISAPNVPFLNLYDLPNNTNSNTTLYEEYIKQNPQAIIMVVCDTSIPLKENPTLKICEKFDPLGRRTVGILTAAKNEGIETKNNNTETTSAVNEVEQNQEPATVVSNKNDYDLHLSRNLLLGYIDTTMHYFPNQAADEYREQQHHIIRHQIFSMIEQSMGRSIYSIVNSVKNELEETRYIFKVVYNDREMTAASYLTDTMNELKRHFKIFSNALGKPQLRSEVRRLLVEQNVLNICAEQYWSDPNILNITKGLPSSDEFYWPYKLDLAAAAMTKSGIGRLTTQVVIDVIMNNMKRLVQIEPLEFHPHIQKKIVEYTGEMLGQKFLSTSDQVENTIKPYKYEVEVTEDEWKDGVKRTIKLLEKELGMCEDMLWTLKKSIGRKRLRSAIRYVLDNEKTNNNQINNNQQSQLLFEKAKEALFLQDRAMILKYRLAALNSRQCKTSENKQFCPEVFLDIVAEKLTYTAVMFIQVELLNEFFFNLPVDVIDDRIMHPMSSVEIEDFAKENPSVEKHLILQDRKKKLEEVMDVLNYLVKRHEFRRPSSASKNT